MHYSVLRRTVRAALAVGLAALVVGTGAGPGPAHAQAGCDYNLGYHAVWRATYTTTAGGRGTETILVRVAHDDDGLLMQEVRNADALYVGQCAGNEVDLSLCNPEGRCLGWIRGTIQGPPTNPVIEVEWQNYCCRGTGRFRR